MKPRRSEWPAKSPTTPAARAQNPRHVARIEPCLGEPVAQIEGPKHRPRRPHELQPALEGRHRAELLLLEQARNVQFAPLLTRIVLGRRDPHVTPRRCEPQLLDVECHQLRAPERAGIVEQEQRPIAQCPDYRTLAGAAAGDARRFRPTPDPRSSAATTWPPEGRRRKRLAG